MTLSEVWFVANHVVLVLSYVMMATVLFNVVQERLFLMLSYRWRVIGRIAALAFFLGQAWEHFEDIFHLGGVPAHFLEASHLIAGTWQALGALTVAVLLYVSAHREQERFGELGEMPLNGDASEGA